MGQVMRSFVTRSRWGLMDYLATIACLLLGLSFVAGDIEGRAFPVLDPSLTVTGVQSMPDGKSLVAGNAVKVRGHCTYIPGSLKWYWGKIGEPHVLVPSYFLDKPQQRPGGLTEWSGIVVSLPATEIRENSYSTVQHRCIFPWKTTSVFYTSPVTQ